MLIKSGEGVVILTRPKKYFHSSYHPQKTNLSFHLPPAPRSLCPGPPKRTPIHPIWPVPQEKNEIKLRNNLTFMPKFGIITLWSLKIRIGLIVCTLH